MYIYLHAIAYQATGCYNIGRLIIMVSACIYIVCLQLMQCSMDTMHVLSGIVHIYFTYILEILQHADI